MKADGFELIPGLAVDPDIKGLGDGLLGRVMRNMPSAKTQIAVTETAIFMRLQPERRRFLAKSGAMRPVRCVSALLARFSAV
jgi:hypothetical protein